MTIFLTIDTSMEKKKKEKPNQLNLFYFSIA